MVQSHLKATQCVIHVHVSIYIYIYICIHIAMYDPCTSLSLSLSLSLYMYIYTYIIDIYIYICLYLCTHIQIVQLPTQSWCLPHIAGFARCLGGAEGGDSLRHGVGAITWRWVRNGCTFKWNPFWDGFTGKLKGNKGQFWGLRQAQIGSHRKWIALVSGNMDDVAVHGEGGRF